MCDIQNIRSIRDFKMKRVIYCNGDSFTAGVNLCDYIFPGYLGYFTQTELSKLQKKIRKFESRKLYYQEKYVEYNKILEGSTDLTFYDNLADGLAKLSGCHTFLEKKHTYLSEMERLDPTISTINNAVPGASMGGICNRTILDLLSLRDKGIKVERVIIQLTSLSRYEIYDSNHNRLMYDRPIGRFLNQKDNAIGNAVGLKYTNHDYVIKFLYHLTSIKETVISITGKPPIIIDSLNGASINTDILETRSHISENNNKNLHIIDSLIEHSMINTAHLNYMKICSKQVNRPFSYDGHYSEDVHKLTGQNLLGLL